MYKLLIAFVVGASALTFSPQPVAAANCTREYQQCLNDSWDTSGATRELANIECAAGYYGCVRKKILGI